MKKLLFIPVLFTAATQLSQAQTPIKAGTVQVGGTVGYYHTSQESLASYYNGSFNQNGTVTYTNSQFGIGPSVGFFVADNLAIGISGNYQVNHYTTSYSFAQPPSGYGNKQLQAGLSVQYYKMLTDQFGLVGTLGGGYQYGNQASDNTPNNEATSKGFNTRLTPGIIFFPISKFSIGASIGGLEYGRSTTKYEGSTFPDNLVSSSFGANFGLSYLAFSGTYYIGR